MSDTPTTDAAFEASDERDGEGWKLARRFERALRAVESATGGFIIVNEALRMNAEGIKS